MSAGVSYGCDRCPETVSVTVTQPGNVPFPEGWTTVVIGGATFNVLCPECCQDLEGFMDGKEFVGTILVANGND